ncbi:MAG: hypothetical protein ACD_23C00478G0005 [uncultured bacterium]|nr:MAG: hypothetical protein ACD_23C00478G0005 [uncultured bacterium]
MNDFQFNKTRRFLTKSGWVDLVRTKGLRWAVPSRVLIGMLLLFPIESIQQLLAFHDAYALSPGMLLRVAEVIAGISFVAGFGIRLAAYPALAIFALRMLANTANSFAWLRDFVNDVIEPHGDWAFGAMYLGAAVLLSDLLRVGSGRWSVDYWLSQKFEATGKSGSKR